MISSSAPSVQECSVRDDFATQRVFFCLERLSKWKREIMFGLSQLQFGQYIGEPFYAAAAAHLPTAKNLPSQPTSWKQGDFDVLLIHRHYGLVVCEIKAFGDNLKDLNLSQLEADKIIRDIFQKAISQLDKANAMLSHLISDIAPGLRITKTISAPNLTTNQVRQAISGDPQLIQELCRCLGTNPSNITGPCLCSDHLSDPETPWKVGGHVMKKLVNWWKRVVEAPGPDCQMTSNLYKILVARFCGPATTITVPCTSPPHLSIKTLSEAVSLTGECYTAQITLFPEQVDLLNGQLPRVLLAGPPGTGKSVVLLLKGIEWLRNGNEVRIISTWSKSRPACTILYHMLLKMTENDDRVMPGQLQFRHYDLIQWEELVNAIEFLVMEANGGPLYFLADEACYVVENFRTFCDNLLEKVPDLHFWAASYIMAHNLQPFDTWPQRVLRRPLRFPPIVLREMLQDGLPKGLKYDERGVPDHADGPPVKHLYHEGQGHSSKYPEDCVTCGRDIASFLHSLCFLDCSSAKSVAKASSSSRIAPPYLQWKDVLVLSYNMDKDLSDTKGIVMGLRRASIPVRVMKDDDIEDVATARSDVVWVAHGKQVRGLERKVIVCVAFPPLTGTFRLTCMSRCTSQLVHVDGPPGNEKSIFFDRYDDY